MKHWISFPGLKIEPFLVDPVAFNLFGRDIMWYGVIICLGMLLAISYAYYRFKKESFTEDEFTNYILFLIPISVICARLYYVIFDPTPNYHSFIDVIAIWRGGIGIYGAIIGGAIVSIIYSKIIKKPILKLLDCVAPAVMIGQIIGRWGNFVNAEAHGGITELPWRMGIAPYHEGLPFSQEYMVYYHPTFLYESIWNTLGFLIAHFVITKRKKTDGNVTFFYFAWYGLGRGFIELLRTDSLRIFGMKVSALVGFTCAIIFGILFIKNVRREKMAIILDGKLTSQNVRQRIKAEVDLIPEGERKPGLAVIIVGDDPASHVYVRNKKKGCEEVGFLSREYALPESTTEEELIALVKKLNTDEEIDGILVQLPLPKHLDDKKVIEAIDSSKDVDAFSYHNVGRITVGDYDFLPCTPAGVMELLREYNIDPSGKNAVVIGRSNIVGKPQALLLLQANATVTVAHSKTQNLAEVTRGADILVVAIGKAKFVTGDMVKEGAVVIDVGMDRDENGKLCGDVDFASVEPKASYITPVPGGVGPMTITELLKNTLTAYKRNKN